MLGNIFLLGYGAVTFLVTHLFVVFYEEPRLGQKFGSQYEDYCGHVGRWLPRFRAFGNEEPS